MDSKEALVIKKLAELGIHQAPKTLSPKLAELAARLEEFEREMGVDLDPELLAKYLG